MHEHLIDLPLPKSTNGNSEFAIDILTGGDLYCKFFSGMLRKGLGSPVAEETSLGWVLSGCVGSSLGSGEFVSIHILNLSEATYVETETIHSFIHEKDHVLLGEVKKFGEVEDICDASSKSTHSFIYEKRFDSLKSSIKFQNGRYTVQVPWKTDSFMLPGNFYQANKGLFRY